MSDETRIGDLLQRWEDAKEQGNVLSAELLCKDCPELTDTVRQKIHQLAAMSQVLDLDRRPRFAGESADTRTDALTESPGVPPKDIPGYEILGTLGRGGAGIVYKARQVGLDRDIALKMILADRHASPSVRQRFTTEANIIAKLTHPHIVPLYVLGEVDGCPYFTMEYLAGGNLDDALAGQALPPAQAARVVAQIARAVHAAHQAGVVHRDLKPSNILLTHCRVLPTGELDLGDVKVGDFGMARKIDPAERLTRPGHVVGTPGYMAPEQAAGRDDEVGPATDVFSLGILLYQALIGVAPFRARTDWEIMMQIVHHAPVRPRKVKPDCPEELEAICLRCLEKRPEDRYPSAEALADDLSRYRDGLSVKASPPKKRLTRRAWLVTAAAAALLLPTAGYFLALGPLRPAQQEVSIGLVHALIGPYSANGDALVEIEQLAVEELNAQGGVLNHRVRGVVCERCPQERLVAEAERLVVQGDVKALFGCWTTDARKSLLPVLAKHQQILFYPVESEGLERDPRVVYLGATPRQLLVPAAGWCRENLKAKKFLLIGQDTRFTRGCYQILLDELSQLKNGTELTYHFMPENAVDWPGVVKKIEGDKPNVVINLIRGNRNVGFFRGLQAGKIFPTDLPILSLGVTDRDLNVMEDFELDGLYLVGSYFQDVDTEENRAFVDRYRARFGEQKTVTDAMEAAYVAVHLWAKACAKAGTFDPLAVREQVPNVSVDGPGGPVQVDPATGYCAKFCRIGRFDADRRLELLYCSERMIPPEPYPGLRSPEEWEEALRGP